MQSNNNEVEENTNSIDNEIINENEKKKSIKNNTLEDNSPIYIIVFLSSLWFGWSAFPPCHYIAFITIVTGYIKCPKSKAIKVLFWLYIIYIILAIIFVTVMLIACPKTCRTMD